MIKCEKSTAMIRVMAHVGRSKLYTIAMKNFIERRKNKELFAKFNEVYSTAPDEEELAIRKASRQQHKRILERLFNPDRHGGEIMVTDLVGVEMRGNIVEAATRVFKSEATAKGWLHAQVPELDGDIPVIVMMEEGGFERVLKALEVRADLELSPLQRIIRITELIEADGSGAEFQSLSLDRVLGEIRNYSIAASKLKIAKIVAEASQTAEHLNAVEQLKENLGAAILQLYTACFEVNRSLIVIHGDSMPAGGLIGFNEYNVFSTWIGVWVVEFSDEVLKSGDQRFTKALLTDYERVYERTVEVFKDEEKAVNWLYGKIPDLGNKVPALVLDEPGGVDLVLETLGQLEYGVFS